MNVGGVINVIGGDGSVTGLIANDFSALITNKGTINLFGGTGTLSGILGIVTGAIGNNHGTVNENFGIGALSGIVFFSGGTYNDGLENLCSIEVDIDIKPNSDPNSINTKSMGRVPVAILGSEDFDVTDVDVTTLAFGPSGAAPSHDLTDPGVYASHLEDVNDDGFTDLVSHYVQKETGLVSSDTEACITGATTGGTPIDGCDSVRVK